MRFVLSPAIVTLVALACGGASAPAAEQRRIDRHLDLVRRELIGWGGQPEAEAGEIPSMHEIGALLMYARGNDGDREAVMRLLGLPSEFSPRTVPEARELAGRVRQITLRAALGETKTLVPEVEAAIRTAEATGRASALPTALLWGLIGEDDKSVEASSETPGLPPAVTVSFLLEAGKAELAKALLDDLGQVDADSNTLRRDKLHLIHAIEMRGVQDLDGVIEQYARIDDRIDVLQTVALRLVESDRHIEGQQLLDHAKRSWGLLGEGPYTPRCETEALFDAGFVEYAEWAFDQWREKEIGVGRGTSSFYWREVGTAAALFNRPELLQQAINALFQIASKVDPDETNGGSAASYMAAALMVLAGNEEDALLRVRETRARFPEEDLSISEGFPSFLDAFRRVGRVERVAELMHEFMPNSTEADWGFEFHRNVPFLVRAGDHNAAWQHAGRIERFWNLRQKSRLRIVLDLVHRGRDEDATRLIDSLESSRSRAALHLFIARDLAGTRMLGTGAMTY